MITTNKKLGLYIHIPFCIKKCGYCGFSSFESTSGSEQKAYVNALIEEIETQSKVYGNNVTVNTIFIGGGTPSLINPALIADILSAVKANFNLDDSPEVTIESNPKSLTADKISVYLANGINRLSIGIQSFDDEILKHLGRVHTADDARETYRLARDGGFGNINVDLMFAAPQHTDESWKRTLEEVTSLEPEHISFYSLQLEENTPFFDAFMKGELRFPPYEKDREMYKTALTHLKNNGYVHYEISNCAKPSFECRHNLKYWSMENYLGIGLSAHSFITGKRFSNTENLHAYIDGERTFWQHENTRADNISEYMITGMRKIEGVDLSAFEKQFGEAFWDVYKKEKAILEEFISGGYLILENNRMKFSAGGIDISNDILCELIVEEEQA